MHSAFIAIFGVLAAYFLYTCWISQRKLAKFPGPPLAPYTSLWNVWDYYATARSEPVRPLHDKYGPVVRMGPNKLYFSNPSSLNDIFGLKNNLAKSKYYNVSAPIANGHAVTNMYASTDGVYHDRIRRAVQAPFNMSSLVSYEDPINDIVNTWIEQVGKRFADKAGPDGIFDMAYWSHYFSLDAVSNVVYSKPYGFLEAGNDIKGMIKDINQSLVYQSGVGQAPWLDKFLNKNPVRLWINRRGFFNSISPPVAHAFQNQAARLEEHDALSKGKAVDSRHYNDILDKLIAAKSEKPDVVTDEEILKVGLAVVFAGADSTAALIGAIFYYLVKNPDVYQKLQAEIDTLPDRPTFGQASKLTYLDAVIKETMRIFPVVRFTVERVTPPEGITISGEFIPGDTVVGANPWAIHRSRETFGDDVDRFRPERWINTDQYQKMASTLFLFGHGKYSCLGINISNMEIFKFVPSVLRAFKFEQATPNMQWRFEQGLFVDLSGILLRVTTRN